MKKAPFQNYLKQFTIKYQLLKIKEKMRSYRERNLKDGHQKKFRH